MSERSGKSNDVLYVDIKDGNRILRPVAQLPHCANTNYTTGFVLSISGHKNDEMFLRDDDGEGNVITLTFGWYELCSMLRVLTKLLDYAEFERGGE